MLESVPVEVRQAAAVNFKNFVKYHWAPRESDGLGAAPMAIPDGEKASKQGAAAAARGGPDAAATAAARRRWQRLLLDSAAVGCMGDLRGVQAAVQQPLHLPCAHDWPPSSWRQELRHRQPRNARKPHMLLHQPHLHTPHLHASTRVQDQVKAHITDLMLSTPPRVRAQLSEALSIISSHDFPARWPSLLPHLVEKVGRGSWLEAAGEDRNSTSSVVAAPAGNSRPAAQRQGCS